MEQKNLIAQGHCGIIIELNIMDQYEITHAVERMEIHNKETAAHEEWAKLRNNDRVWDMDRDHKKAWEIEHPEPSISHWDWEDEMLPIYTFLRKLTLKDGAKATVFEEERPNPEE